MAIVAASGAFFPDAPILFFLSLLFVGIQPAFLGLTFDIH